MHVTIGGSQCKACGYQAKKNKIIVNATIEPAAPPLVAPPAQRGVVTSCPVMSGYLSV